MAFLSFLKKAGQILAEVAETYVGLEPALAKQLPAGATPALDKLDTVFNQVIAVEGAFAAAFPATAPGATPATGAQKLLAASSLVGPILSSVQAITGKQIGDAAAYAAAVQTITGGIADLLNSLKATSDNNTVAAALASPAAAVAASGVTANAPAPSATSAPTK